jgi:hypothetical protein
MNDLAEAFDGSIPETPTNRVEPSYAMVEIFGHRQHYAEIRDVEIAGGKLLEVRDVDTQKVHLYGSAAIFSLTMLTVEEIDAHRADMKRRQEENERWRREMDDRRQARLASQEPVEDDGLPF